MRDEIKKEAMEIAIAIKNRFTALEERLAKLEGSAVKVEYAPYKPTLPPEFHQTGVGIIDGNGNVISFTGVDDIRTKDKGWDVEMKGDGKWKTLKQIPEKLEGRADVQNKIERPRICPVTGMFLDEPIEGKTYFYVNHGMVFSYHFSRNMVPLGYFNDGNCFATREDAERYAKHLKAMAKLRRLGGIYQTKYGKLGCADAIAYYVLSHEYNKLTPEEQNALQWPNEGK